MKFNLKLLNSATRVRSMSEEQKPLPITPDDVRRELASTDARVVTAAASALGALAMRAKLPSDFATLVDDLLNVLADDGRITSDEPAAQAAVLAALTGLCATVDGARHRALERDAVGMTMTRALDGGRALSANATTGASSAGGSTAEDADIAGARSSVCINALDFFRFLQSEGDSRGFNAVRNDPRCMAFALEATKVSGRTELDFMKRVGGVDLIVNLTQQVADDEQKFNDIIREGAFDVFTTALKADEDEVAVRGCIGLACALPRRRDLRLRLAEDGEIIRRLATLMGATDEGIKAFASGLFRALAMDPETKPFVEKGLRDGANLESV